MKRDCCNACGNCRENGRLWIEGYHGKKSLNFTVDADIIKNVAAFSDHGFNISECCVPVIHVTPRNLMDQLLYPVETSENQLMTVDLNVKGDILDDKVTVISTGDQDAFIRFNLVDIQNAFKVFFVDLNLCGDVVVKYTVTVAEFDNVTGPFTVTVKLSFQKNNVELATYTLISNSFLILNSTAITFTSAHIGTTLILGDSVLTFTQFPTFILENLINSSEGADQVTLKLTHHMFATCKQNTLSSFITCVDETCVAG